MSLSLPKPKITNPVLQKASVAFFCYNGSSWKMLFSSEGESCGTISYGGQTYQTIIIGTQCWMAENLNIGTMINGDDDQTDTSIIEKYCYYNDYYSHCDTFGVSTTSAYAFVKSINKGFMNIHCPVK